jgi:spore maturation protein CgeB
MGYDNIGLFHLPGDTTKDAKKLQEKMDEFNPDIVFCDGICSNDSDGISRAFKAAHERGAKTVLWLTEDPYTLPCFEVASKHADLLLTPAAESAIKHQRTNGVNCEPFLFAYSPEAIPKPDEPPQVTRDGILIANYYRWEERKQQQDIIASLAAELGIEIYGLWWDQSGYYTQNKNIIHPRLAYEKVPLMFDTAKIVLGAHIITFSPSQTSMRTYEVMGNGSFYLTYNTISHRILFQENKHYVGWSNKIELENKFLYYLDHDVERQAIADAAKEKIMSEHTYAHRWRVMEPYIKKWIS